MAAVTLALIGFFGFVIMRVTTPQMTTLFSDLSAEDSSGIIKDLERQAIPFELRNEGAVIMVPKDKVTRLRMKLAESNLPKGGGVGYEIFDKSDALGTTSFVQNINHLRALEGELSRTIRAIDRNHLILTGTQYLAELTDYPYRPMDGDPDRSRRLADDGQSLLRRGIAAHVQAIGIQRIAQGRDLRLRAAHLGAADLREVARRHVGGQQADDDHHHQQLQQGEAAGGACLT